MAAVFHKNDWQKQNSKGQTNFAEKRCYIYETAETLWNVSSDNNWKHFFFCVCMYMGGQLKNRFSFWVAINIILKFLLMEAHQCWRIRPARLHCTPLHARFFSGGFVAFWVQYVISGFISRDSLVIQKNKKMLPYLHRNLAWSPCMHFLKVLSESVW